MPVTTASPVEIKNEVVSADVFRVAAINIMLPTNGVANRIDVVVSVGSTQPDTSIDWIEQKQYTIQNEAEVLDENDVVVTPAAPYFDEVIAGATSGGTIYAELKSIVYAHALTRGWIPAGDIT